eukprot:31530_3
MTKLNTTLSDLLTAYSRYTSADSDDYQYSHNTQFLYGISIIGPIDKGGFSISTRYKSLGLVSPPTYCVATPNTREAFKKPKQLITIFSTPGSHSPTSEPQHTTNDICHTINPALDIHS